MNHPSRLTLGTMQDEDGFGIGHVPFLTATFRNQEPLFITYSAVMEKELEGYRIWKDTEGEAWE